MPADSTICFSAKVLPQPSDPEVESQSFCTIKITAPGPGPISKLSSPVVSGWGSEASSFSRSLCICSATMINLEQEVLWWPNRTACGFWQSLDCCGFSFLKKLQTWHPLHIHISIRHIYGRPSSQFSYNVISKLTLKEEGFVWRVQAPAAVLNPSPLSSSLFFFGGNFQKTNAAFSLMYTVCSPSSAVSALFWHYRVWIKSEYEV